MTILGQPLDFQLAPWIGSWLISPALVLLSAAVNRMANRWLDVREARARR